MMELATVANTQSSLTVSGINRALLDSFLQYVDASPKTVETYRKAIGRLLSYFNENGISQPTRQDVLNFKQSLQNGKHLVRGVLREYKPTTIQNYIVASRVFFGWLESQNIYPNIAEHIKGAKLDHKYKKNYLTAEQVKIILGRAKEKATTIIGVRNYAMFALMVTCGLRTIEVARANVEDMRTVGGNSVLFLQGKGRDERADYVKLPLEVETIIRGYLAMRGNASGALFASTSNNGQGQRMTTRAISGIVKAMLVDAGYNDESLTAHSLRHTSATLAILAGNAIQDVQQFARHKNIGTTMIYVHMMDASKNACASSVASSIF